MATTLRYSVVMATICLLKAFAVSAHARSWSDDTGQFKIEADFVAVSGDKVQLKNSDGIIIEVSLSRLSPSDKMFIEEQQSGKRSDATRNQANPSDNDRRLYDKEFKEVVATGFGLTPDDAFKSALSTAIEQTVGLVVDAQTVIQNDDIIKSRILTASAAYVDHYDVLKRSQDGELHQCQIQARVKLRKLQQGLTENKISSGKLSGSDLIVRLNTIEKSDSDTAALITELIRSLPNKVLVAKTNGPSKAIPGEDSATTRLRIPVSLGIDEAEYAAQIRDITLRADKLALDKYSAQCQLPLQKPMAPDNSLNKNNNPLGASLLLKIPSQNNLEPLLYPPTDTLTPDRWFAVTDPFFLFTGKIVGGINNTVLKRTFTSLTTANTAFVGGVDKVTALQKKRQEPLSALVVAHPITAAGNINVVTYAFPESVLTEFEQHVSFGITVRIDLTDDMGKEIKSVSISANPGGSSHFGFINATYKPAGNNSSGSRIPPKVVVITPGLRLGTVFRYNGPLGAGNGGQYALVTQYAGHFYIDILRADLERVRGVKLKAAWSNPSLTTRPLK